MLAVEFCQGSRNLYAEHDGNGWDVRRRESSSEEYKVHPAEGPELANLVVKFMQSGFERAVVYLEDVIVIVPSPTGAYDNFVVIDVITATEWRAFMEPEQMQAVIKLGIAGEELDSEETEDLYKIAEKVLIGCPDVCRPIP